MAKIQEAMLPIMAPLTGSKFDYGRKSLYIVFHCIYVNESKGGGMGISFLDRVCHIVVIKNVLFLVLYVSCWTSYFLHVSEKSIYRWIFVKF